MPIPISCPHCQKLYRLKDELAGKTVKCQNPDCRKAFPVPVPKSAAEVEADALKALGDEPEQDLDTRVIPVACEMCEHKWDVPWAMQGKNVLCPDCRHRNKVPMQKQVKAADWKTGGGRPSMARVEQLEGVIASTEGTRVSGEALVKGGAVTVRYEPRKASFWLLFVGLPLVVVGLLGFGVSSLFRGRADDREQHYMQEALRDQADTKDAPLAPSEGPLFRGALAVAAGEYFTRQDDPARLKDALTQFSRARQELDGAAPSAGRTHLLGELAVALLGLGGTDDQVTLGTRVRWAPGGRAKLNEKQFSVQAELADVLGVVRREDKLVSLADRHLLARRLARRAAVLGQTATLAPVVPRLFGDAEAADGQALAALEALRATGDAATAKQAAADLAPLAAGGAGPFLQALALAVGPVDGIKTAPPPPGGQVPGDPARQTHTAALLVAKQADAAVELASRGKEPATRGSRALALALAAEWADDPKPAVLAAADLVEKEAKPKDVGVPDSTLVRLAGAAGRAGLADKAELFVKAVEKPDARAWAAAEAARGRFDAAPAQVATDADTKLPDDPKEFRSGVAWHLFLAARQTARATTSAGAAVTFDRWGHGTFRPFGYAGLALGLQDAKLK